MNFNENYLWSDKMNLRLFKLPSAKVLLKLEFETEDQVLLGLQTVNFVVCHINVAWSIFKINILITEGQHPPAFCPLSNY